jgi:hypothetical protein
MMFITPTPPTRKPTVDSRNITAIVANTMASNDAIIVSAVPTSKLSSRSNAPCGGGATLR